MELAGRLGRGAQDLPFREKSPMYLLTVDRQLRNEFNESARWGMQIHVILHRGFHFEESTVKRKIDDSGRTFQRGYRYNRRRGISLSVKKWKKELGIITMAIGVILII